MSTIRIGNDERPLDQADPQWITQEIHGRQRDGQRLCVRVSIKTEDLNIGLTTPACGGGGGGGGRPPTQRERSVLDLWNELGLNRADFEPGAVVAFVQRVRKYL